MTSTTYQPGELFVYTNGDKWELGQVKYQASDTTYACYYSTGDTAARTPVANMHKLANAGWSHVERTGADNECEFTHFEDVDGNKGWMCSKCGKFVAYTYELGYLIEPNYCQACGRVVVSCQAS